MTIRTAAAAFAGTTASTTTQMGTNTSVDYRLFQTINGLAGTHPVLDLVMIACAKYSPFVYALVLVALWLTWSHRVQRGAFLAGVSALIALGIGQIVGALFPRERPYLVHHVNLLITRSPDTSFPSDHATLAFAVGVMVWQFNRRLGVALLLFAVLTAFARVFVGVHYPSDVLGGAVLGTVVSLLVAAVCVRDGPAKLLNGFLEVLARWHLAAAGPSVNS